MPRWFATLFAAFCLACTGLVSAPAMAERTSQAAPAVEALQSTFDIGVAGATGADEAGPDADSSDSLSDLPDLIGMPLSAAVPVSAVRALRDGRGSLLPSPPIEAPQRPPRSAAFIA